MLLRVSRAKTPRLVLDVQGKLRRKEAERVFRHAKGFV